MIGHARLHWLTGALATLTLISIVGLMSLASEPVALEATISISDDDFGDGAVLLYRGMLDGECKGYHVTTLTAGTAATLAGSAKTAPDCHSEIGLFSKGDPTIVHDPSWSPAAQNHKVPLKLGNQGGPIAVPVDIWLHPYLKSLKDWAEYEAALANWLLWENKAGVLLDPISINEVPAISTTTVGANCLTTTVTGDKKLYAEDALNVYYIPYYESYTYALGWACIPPTNVIYLTLTRSETTLAHEVGHALGLHHAGPASDYPYVGLTTSNIMLPGKPYEYTSFRDHLTLGQSFRISVEKQSWLNHPLGPGSGAQSPRLCQKIFEDYESCPPVTMGWP